MKRTTKLAKQIQFLVYICLLGIGLGSAYADSALGVQSREVGFYPDNREMQQRLVNHFYAQKKYKQSIEVLNEVLKKDPNNVSLLIKEAGIYADIEQYSKSIAILDRAIRLDPQNSKAIELRNKLLYLKCLEPKNEIGIDIDEAYVSDLTQWWDYASIHYYRFTDGGTFGGRINFSKRFGTTGEQYQLEAYPKIFDIGMVALSYAYANSTQIVFPDMQYTIEPYFYLRGDFEVSLGERFLRSQSVGIYDTTASLGKYIGNYFIWMRDYHFTPKASDLLELGLTRYFSDKNSFLTIKGVYGRAPDIADLAPLNQIIVLKMYGLSLSGKMPLTKSLFARAGVGYMHQRFPSERIRNISDISAGLYWQF